MAEARVEPLLGVVSQPTNGKVSPAAAAAVVCRRKSRRFMRDLPDADEDECPAATGRIRAAARPGVEASKLPEKFSADNLLGKVNLDPD
ncbi:MAG: hypothetical protein AMXMBFR13_21840 [Phycisphaerae bacterium]